MDYIKEYRKLAKQGFNKYVKIVYERTKDNKHTYHGKIVKLRRDSFILLLNDEKPVDIGLRNIKEFEIL